MTRDVLLAAAGQRAVRHFFASQPAARRLAHRFVAGETIEDGIRVVRQLNARGLSASLDQLGEHTQTESAAAAAAAAYAALLERIGSERLQANVSLKLTQLGLEIDPLACQARLASIVEHARRLSNFVRIDMEGSAHTEQTLRIFAHVFERFPESVGPVIQAYLYRSERDVPALIRLGARVRLCKGAYSEPPSVAFPKKFDVDRNFVRLMELLLLLARYPAIATHDAAIIEHAKYFAKQWEIGADQFEFQMLYGIRRDLQASLVDAGYRVRVYVPFGAAWYPYLTRRLAERPANSVFVIGSLLREAFALPRKSLQRAERSPETGRGEGAW